MEIFAVFISLLATVSWGLTLTFVIALFVIGSFLEEENVIGAFAMFIVATLVGGLVFYGWEQSWELVKSAPQNIGYFAIYIAIGLAWSVYKWFRYVRKLATTMQAGILQTKKRYADTDLVPGSKDAEKYLTALAATINASLSGITGNRLTEEGLKKMGDVTLVKLVEFLEFTPMQKKSVISGWIGFWPCSLAITLTRGILVDLWDWLVDICRSVYNSISKWAVSSALTDVAEEASKVNKA